MITTYVAVHDESLIQPERFASMPDVVWLFLGPRSGPTGPSIVRCTDYEPDHPNLYDFAGFDVLVRHNLMRSEHSIFLQYDHDVDDPYAADRLEKMLRTELGMVACVPAGYDPQNWMLQVPGFTGDFHRALAACGEHGDWSTLDVAWWPTTQGHAWRTSYFYTFMNWIRPGLEAIADTPFAGHMAERLLTVYCARTHPAQVRTGLFTHRSGDCHGTGALMRGEHAVAAAKAAEFGR